MKRVTRSLALRVLPVVILLIFSALAVPVIRAGVAPSDIQTVSVEFTDFPADSRLYPRDERDSATVAISGHVITEGCDSLEVMIYRDDIPWHSALLPLVYSDSSGAPFSMNMAIPAGTFSHDFFVSVFHDTTMEIVADAYDIVSGDAFLIQGQSNAVAFDHHDEHLGNLSQRQWIRSFGTSSYDSAQVPLDLEWHLAEGEGAYGPGTVGQWGLRMGQLIVDLFRMPVAILNGGVGGSGIAYHQRNDADPEDIATNYGRLLFRAREAGLEASVKAILWYQGEADGAIDPLDYLAEFESLRDSWIEDYPGLKKIYVFQVRDGCGDPTLQLRDMMRRFGDIFPKVEVMSTTAVPGHDDCHYSYLGYRVIGDHIARMVARKFYASIELQNVSPPDPSTASYVDNNHDKILIFFRDPDDRLIWDTGAEDFFVINDAEATIKSGKVVGGNKLLLNLNGPSSATAISYLGHRGDGPWVTNRNGVGLFAFDSLPIE